ncbi:hypothetical protein ACIGO6_40010 [Streptomyces sp. NPDC053750]|uniref:hypothetical protein n=1 Tax=Streptomyces sp. NPDC053750 TaxID=3365714 RepID=UPI0037D69B86
MSITGAVKYFKVPTGGAKPFDITLGPDGNMWFTEYNSHKIGKITPAGAPSPSTGAHRGIVPGPDHHRPPRQDMVHPRQHQQDCRRRLNSEPFPAGEK